MLAVDVSKTPLNPSPDDDLDVEAADPVVPPTGDGPLASLKKSYALNVDSRKAAPKGKTKVKRNKNKRVEGSDHEKARSEHEDSCIIHIAWSRVPM